MKNLSEKPVSLVEEAYVSYREGVLRFIACRIDKPDEAEDMTQDVFVRLMEYKPMLCRSTLQNFVFTIAHNLVNDYLRRYYKWQEISTYLYESMSAQSNETEDGIVARDLAREEYLHVLRMPKQRAAIYSLCRYEEMSADEIADRLNLARRTVDNHLRLGRKEMRQHMSLCI